MAKFKYTGPPQKPQQTPPRNRYRPRAHLRKQDNEPADARVCEMMQRAYYLRKRGFPGMMRVTLQGLVDYLITHCPPELVHDQK